MDYLLVFLLLFAGLFLFLLEVFIPSHGLLTVGAVTCLAVSLYLAFRIGIPLGVFALLLVLVLLPIEIVFGVKLFPRTWVGRRVVLAARNKTARAERSSDESIFSLEGRTGTTVSDCRPSGVAEIEGRRVDVVAEGTMIDANRPVKVVRIDGNRVVVREKQA